MLIGGGTLHDCSSKLGKCSVDEGTVCPGKDSRRDGRMQDRTKNGLEINNFELRGDAKVPEASEHVVGTLGRRNLTVFFDAVSTVMGNVWARIPGMFCDPAEGSPALLFVC